MDQFFYGFLHLAGVITLFGAIGALFCAESAQAQKLASILHGLALVVILVAGFGLLAKLYENNFAWWVIAKLVIWLALGAMLGVAKRKVLPAPAGILIAIGLGLAAAYLGVYGKLL